MIFYHTPKQFTMSKFISLKPQLLFVFREKNDFLSSFTVEGPAGI